MIMAVLYSIIGVVFFLLFATCPGKYYVSLIHCISFHIDDDNGNNDGNNE